VISVGHHFTADHRVDIADHLVLVVGLTAPLIADARNCNGFPGLKSRQLSLDGTRTRSTEANDLISVESSLWISNTHAKSALLDFGEERVHRRGWISRGPGIENVSSQSRSQISSGVTNIGYRQ